MVQDRCMSMEKFDLDKLKRASSVLKGGGVVIIATETFYCMAANPFSEDAVKKIFLLKGRSFNKPLPLIASSVRVASGMIAEESDDAFELGQKFWPGSLTVLVNLKVTFPPALRGARNRVGIRIPPQCPASALAEISGGWITATSANLSGGLNASSIEQIPESLLKLADCVIDSGQTAGGLPSTVMALELGEPVIYRAGAVSLESLKQRLPLQSDKST